MCIKRNKFKIKDMKNSLLTLLITTFNSIAFGQADFITVWNMANLGAQPNELRLNLAVATGGATYFWETIPSGTTGSGTFAAGSGISIIPGIPTGSTIRLNIAPQNLNAFTLFTGGDRQRLIEVEQWGTAQWTNGFEMFRGCNNLAIISAPDIPNLSNCTDLSSFFRECISLNFVNNINNWDVSNITNMSNMFTQASGFNQALGLWILNPNVNLSSVFTGNSTIDCDNYSETLIGWQQNNPGVTNRTVGANFLMHKFYALEAREILINTQGWTINDIGLGVCEFFETVWDLSIPGSAPDQIQFYSAGLSSIANYGYFWTAYPSGQTSPGMLLHSTVEGLKTISDLPPGEIIYLRIFSNIFNRFYMDDGVDKSRLIEINNFGSVNWTSMEDAFDGCNNLQVTATYNPFLNNVSSTAEMFKNCSSLTSIPNMENWNTSTINNMTAMFMGASSFDHNISSWNTSNVNNMSYMFYGASAFNQPIGAWNTSSVTNMTHMFFQATQFNQPLNTWDISSVNTISHMFWQASNFNQALNNWNTGNVTDMTATFFQATQFNQNLNNWNTASVQSMTSTFSGASSFNGDISTWNTGNVQTMNGMFFNASNFNNNISAWNTNSVNTMAAMFEGATNFNQAIGSWQTGGVTNMFNMFRNAVNFNQAIGSWNVGDVQNMGGMFDGAAQFNQDIGTWNPIQVTNFSNMFRNATNFNQDIGSWDMGNAQTTNAMFQNAINFNQNLNNWAFGNLTNVANMFNGASAFNYPVDQWFMNTVTSMTGMFNNASSFNQNLSTWILNPSVTLNNMLNNTALDCENYASTLIGWQTNNPTLIGKNLGAAGLNYGNYALPARNILTGSQLWTINDAGVSASCSEFITVWNTPTAMTPSTSLSFNATVLPGGANYYWETIPLNLSGYGVIPAGSGAKTINGLPPGTTIRLLIDPKQMEYFHMSSGINSPNLIDVEQWGSMTWTNMALSFQGCTNLNITATDIPNTVNVSSMSQTFRNCTSLIGPANIGQWNTSGVFNMSGTFQNAPLFNQDIGSWDVENVNTMANMFRDAITFNQNLNSWNTNSLTNLGSTFFNAQSYNQDMSNWNTASVTNMINTFYQATSFNGDITTWNTALANNMSNMFNGASSFNRGISSWNTQNVSNMTGMFRGSAAFNQDLSSWNVENVNSFDAMFENADDFNQNLGAWLLNNTVQMNNMLDNSGMDCANYSATLMGWRDNNPGVNDVPLGAVNMYYSSTAADARNDLNGQNWMINGDNEIYTNPLLLAPYETIVALADCGGEFVNINNNEQKILVIEANGNTIDFGAITVTATNDFIPTLPAGVTIVDNGSNGYYEIEDGVNTFRMSRRLFTVVAPGVYNVNGGVLVRFYFDPSDLNTMITDPTNTGTINDFGWFKSSLNDIDALVGEMSPSAPNLLSAQPITAIYGDENGLDFVEFVVPNFSTFGFYANTITPLPVTMTSFNANCDESIVSITWTTASEYNASHYSVQTSREGHNWTEVAQIEAAGTSNQTTNYFYQDMMIGGVSYYRLVQVDFDGEYEVFGPISVDCEINESSMKVYPNPTDADFTVLIQTTETFENANIELVDLSGRSVQVKQMNIAPGSTMIKFETDKINPGTYIVRIKGENDKFTPIRVVIL